MNSILSVPFYRIYVDDFVEGCCLNLCLSPFRYLVGQRLVNYHYPSAQGDISRDVNSDL